MPIFCFQVLILQLDFPLSYANQICSGTLISSKHVISTPNCFNTVEDTPFPFLYNVILGDTILGTEYDVPSLTIEVSKISVHPDYVPITTNAIAILELSEEVPLDKYPNIKPACLPTQDIDLSGSTATVSGWSNDNIDTNLPYLNSWLHEVNLTVTDCAPWTDLDIDSDIDIDITSSICAEEEGKYVCGDPGGPLVYHDPGNNYGLTLIGLTLFGSSSCDINSITTPDVPGLFTRVSYYIEWVKSEITQATTCPPPPL